jgi:hypothetical protein
MLDDGAGDLGARQQRRADLAVGHQHVAEFDRGADVALDSLDRDGLIGSDAILLTAGANDCEHGNNRFIWPTLAGCVLKTGAGNAPAR